MEDQDLEGEEEEGEMMYQPEQMLRMKGECVFLDNDDSGNSQEVH